jgi:DNA-binding MarR family transcriptional regulator
MTKPKSEAATLAWSRLRDLVLGDDDPRRRVSDALGITYFKVKVLVLLLRQTASASDLVRQLASDKTYISLILRDLEDDDSVTRITSPTDRRTKLIALTDRGRALAQRAVAILDQPPAEFSRLTRQELEILLVLLDKLTGAATSARPND